ncbi:MAG: hypothetical protein NTW20_06390 [Rhodobacterales bacterium]|nr:hypothetical protein [Rhodobacterales bacterium]
MAQEGEELTVAQRLGHLLDRGLLPAGGPAEAAERLIERLERPARVALLGLPGSGKSAILNLLTGSVLVPETLRLPTIIAQYRQDERMVCTLSDGKTQTVPGRDLNDVLTLNPALVTLEADLPALKIISLLEVSAGPMDAEQRRAAIWASKRADILIWCTTSYLPKEQQVWESMPDTVKDNGFLFLTKVDLLGGRDAAQGMLERVELRAGEEFRQVLSISAKQARAAMPPGGPVDRDLFRDSGAAAVITTIKTRVQMARRADTDMAELLLARHVEAGGIVARRFADLDETLRADPPPQWSPPPETVPEPVVPAETQPRPEAYTEPEVRPEPEPEMQPEPEIQPEPEPKVLADAAVPSVPEVDPEPQNVAQPEPEPEPEPEVEPDLPGIPEVYPEVTPKPAPDAGMQPVTGRKRFSDRIKQMPLPDDAATQPMVPLRSTWKSKSETATPAVPTPRGQPGPPLVARLPDEVAEAPSPVIQPEPVAARPPTSEVLRPGPIVPEPDSETESELEGAPDDAEVEAMLAAVQAATDEPPDPGFRVERPMPTDSTPLAERSARTQLFGSRKPVAAAPAAAKPGERTARPGEPVTRVRAPAPPAAAPPRPVAPLPEDLASPHLAAMRERLPEASASDTTPQRGDRRERPRIAARAQTVTPALAKFADGSLPAGGAEKEILAAAIGLIIARSTDLAGSVEPSAKVPVDMVLEHCRDTTEQVIDTLSRAGSADLLRIKVDLSQVQDLIMLMLLEKGHAPADDALTLLLQIRRDLETLHGV